MAKALLGNGTVDAPSGVRLRHATEQTLRCSARVAVVIGHSADDRMLERLDGSTA